MIRAVISLLYSSANLRDDLVGHQVALCGRDLARDDWSVIGAPSEVRRVEGFVPLISGDDFPAVASASANQT